MAKTNGIDQLRNALQAHQVGEPWARAEITERVQLKLLAMIQRRMARLTSLGAREEPSDILQNVLMRLDRTLRRRKPASIDELLRLGARLIRCEAIDLVRHHFGTDPGRRRPEASFAECDELAAATQLSADADPWSAIDEAYRFLSAEERTIIELLVFREMKQADAAAVVGIPLRTFKRRWHAVRQQIVARLASRRCPVRQHAQSSGSSLPQP